MTFLLQTCSKNQCFPSCKNQLPFHCFLHWFFNILVHFCIKFELFSDVDSHIDFRLHLYSIWTPKWLPKSTFFQQLCLSRAPKGVQRSWNIGIFLQTAVLGALLAHAGDLVASFWFNFSRFGFHATFFSIIFFCNLFNLKGLGRGWGKEQCLT